MILINENFNMWSIGSTEGFIEVPDNFEPVFKLPEEGCEWVWEDFSKGIYTQKKVILPEPERTPESEQEWVKTEFSEFVDPLIMMFWSEDVRCAVYNKQDIKDYANKLRNYVTNSKGTLIICGDKPLRPTPKNTK